MLNQLKIRLISQLIKGISRVLQELLKCFNIFIFLTISSCFTCKFLFRFKRSTVIISSKISDSTKISQSWFIAIIVPETSWCFLVIIAILYIDIYIIHWYNNINALFISLIQSVMGTIFKYYFFISIIWVVSCLRCDCYSSFNKYIRITTIT